MAMRPGAPRLYPNDPATLMKEDGVAKVCADEMGAYMPKCSILRSALDDLLALRNAPVYEARFSHKSYVFRPGRTAHTALRVIRRNFAGYLWYMKGDLSTILDGLKAHDSITGDSEVIFVRVS
ncbi:unnamed protein product [Rhodiola kirilowii]